MLEHEAVAAWNLLLSPVEASGADALSASLALVDSEGFCGL